MGRRLVYTQVSAEFDSPVVYMTLIKKTTVEEYNAEGKLVKKTVTEEHREQALPQPWPDILTPPRQHQPYEVWCATATDADFAAAVNGIDHKTHTHAKVATL